MKDSPEQEPRSIDFDIEAPAGDAGTAPSSDAAPVHRAPLLGGGAAVMPRGDFPSHFVFSKAQVAEMNANAERRTPKPDAQP